jgi:CBS domain-containing protein
MKVYQIMRSEPRTCSPDDTAATTGRLMAEVDCGWLPVVEDGRTGAGRGRMRRTLRAASRGRCVRRPSGGVGRRHPPAVGAPVPASVAPAVAEG